MVLGRRGGTPPLGSADDAVREFDAPIALATPFRRRAGAEEVRKHAIRRLVVRPVDVAVQDGEARAAERVEESVGVEEAVASPIGPAPGCAGCVVDGDEDRASLETGIRDDAAERFELRSAQPAVCETREAGNAGGEQAHDGSFFSEQADEGVGPLAGGSLEVAREELTEVALEAG